VFEIMQSVRLQANRNITSKHGNLLKVWVWLRRENFRETDLVQRTEKERKDNSLYLDPTLVGD
jgi:hypothetical protein